MDPQAATFKIFQPFLVSLPHLLLSNVKQITFCDSYTIKQLNNSTPFFFNIFNLMSCEELLNFFIQLFFVQDDFSSSICRTQYLTITDEVCWVIFFLHEYIPLQQWLKTLFLRIKTEFFIIVVVVIFGARYAG
jgi:hypothetical protein